MCPHAPITHDLHSVTAALQTLGMDAEDLPRVSGLIFNRFLELLDIAEQQIRATDLEHARATMHILRGCMVNTLFPEVYEEIEQLRGAVLCQAWQEAEQQLLQVRLVFAPIQAVMGHWLEQKGVTSGRSP
ncbi:MAG: hypothetical protein H7837_07510 [Magnetococcus sp. MYC-9]